MINVCILFQSMDGLEQCLTLRKLYLYSNVIKKIQKISHMLELEVLWLNNNEITIIEVISTEMIFF